MASLVVRKYVCQNKQTHEGIFLLEVCPDCYAPIERRPHKVLNRVPKDVWTQVINCRKTARQTFLIRRACQDPSNVPVEVDFPSDIRNQPTVCAADESHSVFDFVRIPVCVECGHAVTEVQLTKMPISSGNPISNAYKAWVKVRGKYFKERIESQSEDLKG